MTRKIEEQMVDAIRSQHGWHNSNTVVRYGWADEVEVRLHNNLIAKRDKDGNWEFTLAGWNTPTTRSRLSALMREFAPNCRGIGTRNGQAEVRYDRDSLTKKVSDSEWFTA